MRRLAIALYIILFSVFGNAQIAAPALSGTEKLQIQVIAQRIEIAQLRAQAAQAEFDRAREEFTKLIASLQKDGYTLDIQKMEYVKKEPAAK
jgi:hypothetical protein